MIRRVIAFKFLFVIAAAGAVRYAPEQRQENATAIRPDAMITLKREGLIVTIVADGRVLVEGQTFDFDVSAIKTSISREELQKLLGGFDRIDFFSLRDQYRDAADGCSSDGRTHCVAFLQTTSLTALPRATPGWK